SWYRPCSPGPSTCTSPKRSNMTKVSSFFSVCGLSSLRAEVAATYHLSPIWILSAMSDSSGGVRVAVRQCAIDLEIAFRHHRGGEALLEDLAAAPAVDAVDAPRGGDRLLLIVHD